MKTSWIVCVVLAAWQLGGPGLPAAGIEGMLLVCDSAGDRVVGLVDHDRSGFVEQEAPGEIVVYYDDASPGPDLSTPSHVVRGPGAVALLLDGGTVDAVLALEDKNGDGDANDDGEVWTFYDASAGGPRLSTANGLVAAADGSYYVCDDGSGAKRVLRLTDANGDGDALDAEEVSIVYDATALSVPVIGDMESIAWAETGELYLGDSTLQAVFRLRDGNADGDFLDVDEVQLFFQGPTEAPLGDIDALYAVGPAVYVGDNDSGRILRLADGNGDGDAGDEGEAQAFLDNTSSLRVGSATDFLPVPDLGFVLLDNSRDAVVVLEDANRDGDVLDAGEVYAWLKDDGSTLATPSGLALLPRRDTPPPAAQFVRGDATADGKLDISDPVTTLGYLFLGRTLAACIDALDADDTGVVNISDPIYLLNFLFSGGAAPPAPFPGSDVDPTADALTCSP